MGLFSTLSAKQIKPTFARRPFEGAPPSTGRSSTSSGFDLSSGAAPFAELVTRERQRDPAKNSYVPKGTLRALGLMPPRPTKLPQAPTSSDPRDVRDRKGGAERAAPGARHKQRPSSCQRQRPAASSQSRTVASGERRPLSAAAGGHQTVYQTPRDPNGDPSSSRTRSPHHSHDDHHHSHHHHHSRARSSSGRSASDASSSMDLLSATLDRGNSLVPAYDRLRETVRDQNRDRAVFGFGALRGERLADADRNIIPMLSTQQEYHDERVVGHVTSPLYERMNGPHWGRRHGFDKTIFPLPIKMTYLTHR